MSNRRKAAWDYLDALAADIALVQEGIPPPGRDGVVWREIGGTRRWGSGVVSYGLPMKEVVLLSDSHPGCVAVAELTLPDGSVLTAVSMYGLIDPDGYATTTVHRIISDLVPVLVEKGRQVILGGDLNISTQFPSPWRAQHKTVFERLKAHGLHDCLGKFFPTHVQTQRHPRSTVPWQNDYLFADRWLFRRLKDCRPVDEPRAWEISSHCPVAAVFDL